MVPNVRRVIPSLYILLYRLFKRRFIIDGGTMTKLKSGQIRWTYSPSFSLAPNKDEDGEIENIQLTVMQSEPNFNFGPFAKMLRQVPEGFPPQQGGLFSLRNKDYHSIISKEANRFLRKLAELHDSQPIVAIKIAFLTFYSIDPRFAFASEVWKRLIEWIELPEKWEERIDAALFIRSLEPRLYFYHRAPELCLGLTLGRIYRYRAQTSPSFVLERIKRTWPDGSGPLFYSTEPRLFVELGRSVALVDPHFTKCALMSYLSWSADGEAFSREITEELFRLEQAYPYALAKDQAKVMITLLEKGDRSSISWNFCLERLLFLANQAENRDSAGWWLRMVAMNAPDGGTISRLAIQGFEACANSFPPLSSDNHGPLHSHLHFLLSSNEVVSVYKNRVPPLTSSPEALHSLARIADTASWKFIDGLIDCDNPHVLHALGMAVKRGDEPFSDKAVVRLQEVFRRFARISPTDASEALIELGQFSMCTSQPPLEHRPQRCREVYFLLKPMLAEVAPSLLDETERRAFRHWSD